MASSNLNSILLKIRRELKLQSNVNVRQSGKNFFREKIKLYGVRAPVVKKIAREHFKSVYDHHGKAEIYFLCENLWKSGYLEESFIACEWSYRLREKYEEKDFKLFEKWIDKYVSNWASCDTFCNHTVGEFLLQFPAYVATLKKWTKSTNRWKRRAAAVSLIIPAREGKFLNDVLEIAEILLHDEDDLVQKGYGWMLKAASQVHQQAVFEYVMSKKPVMPRTAFRYAIEKMPDELKKLAMQK